MATEVVATTVAVMLDENEDAGTVPTFTGYEPKQAVTGLEEVAVFAPPYRFRSLPR